MKTEYSNLLRSLSVILIVLLFSTASSAAEILLGDTTICAGTEAQLEIVGDFEIIDWSPAETLSCDNCPNPRATPTETTTYTATFEESDGTLGSLSITVFLPSLNTLPDITTCKNTPITLNAGDEFIGFSYGWQPAGLFSCQDCPNPTLLNDNALTNTTVTYSLSSASCTLTETFQLTILDADGPVYDILEDARFCAGDVFDIGGPADAGTVYSWTSDPVGLVSASSNPNVAPTVSTDYFLEVTKAGCAITTLDTVRAILSAPPAINFAQDVFEICQGDTIAMTSGLTVEPNITYLWSPDLGLIDKDSLNTYAAPTTTSVYTLTATKGVCEVTDDITINVIPNDVNIVQDSALICRGDMLQLTATGAPDRDAIAWSPAAGLDVTLGDTVNVTDLRGEFYIYARTQNGVCSAVDSVFYRVDSLPVDMGIMPQDTTICEGEYVILRSPVFEPADFPDIVFMWFPESGNYQTGDSLYNAVVTPTDTTDYVRYVANGKCIDSSLVTVNVQPVETINVSPADTTICLGESFQYQILSENLTDFVWMPSGGLSCGDCDDPVATPPSSTQFMIEAVDNMGCPVMGGASVTVVPPPELDLVGTSNICPGEFVTLNGSAIPGITYAWTSTDPDFADTNNPTPFAQPATNSSYTAVLSGPICADVTQTIQINIIQPVTLNVSDNQTICPGGEVTLNADVGGADGSITWSTGETGPSITVQPTGQMTSYGVTFNNRCESLSTSIGVSIEDDFNPGIIPSPAKTTVNLGESIDLNVNVALPGDQISSISWTENGSGIGSGSTINVQPPLEGANEYIVKVTTVNGCEKEGIIVIFAIVPSVIIPNAFTPNNDGLNDELNIVRIIGDIEISTLVIYDRWGQKVYEEADGGWDGTFKGKPMPSDVYVYLAEILFPDGTTVVQKGEISLIR